MDHCQSYQVVCFLTGFDVLCDAYVHSLTRLSAKLYVILSYFINISDLHFLFYTRFRQNIARFVISYTYCQFYQNNSIRYDYFAFSFLILIDSATVAFFSSNCHFRIQI